MLLEHRLSVLLQLHLYYPLTTWIKWIGQRHLQDEMRNTQVWEFGATYIRDFTVCHQHIISFFLPVYSCPCHIEDVSQPQLGYLYSQGHVHTPAGEKAYARLPCLPHYTGRGNPEYPPEWTDKACGDHESHHALGSHHCHQEWRWNGWDSVAGGARCLIWVHR